MTFERDNLPEPVSYFESEGLALNGPRSAKWKTTRCDFHGGSDSMRVNTASGAFVCMAGCGAKGGDVLAYHMAAHGLAFVDAAKALGCWRDDGKQVSRAKPSPVPARALLECVAHEVLIASMVAADLARGRAVSGTDRERLVVAAGRIGRIADEVRHA